MKFGVVLLALALAVTFPVAHAQSNGFMEDGSGDVNVAVADTDLGNPAGMADHLDLLGLDILEVPSGFQMTLSLKTLTPTAATFMDSAEYRIYFFYGDVEYALIIKGDVGPLGEGPFYSGYVAEVERENNYEFYAYRDDMEVDPDEGASTLTILVPRASITDGLGAPANTGATLTDFHAESSRDTLQIRMQNNQDLVSVADRMPDADTVGPFVVQMGVKQEGDAHLWSEAPYRLSNGGATSMVYQVAAYNAGDRQSFALAAENLPKDWEVSLPFDRIILDEGESKTFPILVTTPSGHLHGATLSFLLTMTGETDAGDVGRMEIGITYPIIPQPAGHHPKLWVHSYFPYSNGISELATVLGPRAGGAPQAYMNALEDDPSDLGEPVPAWGTPIPAFDSRYDWWMPLVPDLGMGLDFDTSKKATLDIPIHYDYIAQEAVLSGELYLWTEAIDGGVTVGTIQPSSPMSWGPGLQNFEVIMDISDEADFIPYSPNAYLYLELQLDGNFIGVGPVGPGAQPFLMPGASMVLPLNEYHDEVQSFYSEVEALRFGTNLLERSVNPGKTVVFETHLRNMETETQPVALNLTGANLEWARILGDTQFDLAPGAEKTVAVAVVIPAEAMDGVVDLVLKASNRDDPFKAAILDLIAIIDTEAQHPDEADKIPTLDVKSGSEKKAPGFEVAAISLGLIAIALVARRRRA